MGPRLVDKKKARGIWVMVTQAALNATSSTKCGVEVGASTDKSSEITVTEYAVSPIMLPEDCVVKVRPSIGGNGVTATA